MSEEATAQDLPPFDVRRLIADLKKNDPEAIGLAYRMTFGNELGRLVLAHHLNDCGVGMLIAAESDAQLRELVGRHNAAIELAAKANFGQAAIVAAVLSGRLEEEPHEDQRTEVPAYVPPAGDDDSF